MKKKCEKCGSFIKTKLVEKYEDKNLGIPGVFIWNTVALESCPRCPRSQSVIIPNLQGLIAAVAVDAEKQTPRRGKKSRVAAKKPDTSDEETDKAKKDAKKVAA